MRDPDELFAALSRSKFRRRFRLEPRERTYLADRGRDVILQHAREFITERLARAQPPNDGRQTPMRGHPVFVAQHATATCCRGCLAKWHRIEPGRALAEVEITYVLGVLQRWLEAQAVDEQPPAGTLWEL